MSISGKALTFYKDVVGIGNLACRTCAQMATGSGQMAGIISYLRKSGYEFSHENKGVCSVCDKETKRLDRLLNAQATGERKRAVKSEKEMGPAYPALQLTQNNHKFYFTTIPVEDLFPYCFVSHRDSDPIKGFQRALDENRAEDIAQYLAMGTGSIPSNIVLSAQEVAGFRYNHKNKQISFSRVENAFLVIDGQHRLWGYQKSSIRHRVPVAIYDGLTRTEETRLFIDINTKQRGVPAALLLDIKNLAEIESEKEQVLRYIFDKLQVDPNSPLYGRLSPSKSASGKISRVTFNRALSSVVYSGILSARPNEVKYKLIVNYLNAFDAELLDKGYLLKANFFEAIFEILDDVVNISISQFGMSKQSQIQSVIHPLCKLDLSAIAFKKAEIVSLFKTTLRNTSIKLTEDML